MQVDEDTGTEQEAAGAEAEEKTAPEASTASEEGTGDEAAEGSREGDGKDKPEDSEEEKRLKRLAYLQRQERRHLRERERQARELEAENRRLTEELRRRTSANGSDGTGAAKTPPRRADFPDGEEGYDAYRDAKDDWRDAQADARRSAEDERRRQSEDRARGQADIHRAAQAVLRAGEDAYGDDWQDIADSYVPPAALEALTVAKSGGKPMGHVIANWLYENPEAVRALERQSAAEQAVSIGEIKAHLVAAGQAAAKPKPKQTQAKPPIKPVAGAGGGPGPVDMAKLAKENPAKWIEARNKQIAARYK